MTTGQITLSTTGIDMTQETANNIQDLQQAFNNHCSEQAVAELSYCEKIDKLMPLVDLIPMLQELAKDKEVNIAMDARFSKIARIIMTIAGIITAIYVIIQLIFKLK